MATKITAPKHVGYIVDGNRRWAREHGLPTYEGHLAGYNSLKEVIFETFASGVQYVTIYAFSTENWKRGEGEVGKLMKLALALFKTDLHDFAANDIRLRVLGVTDGLDDKLIEAARTAEEETANLSGGTLCICFNYGGQREIADAARRCVEDGLAAEQVDEAAIGQRLYAPDVPSIDIVVRTSGEQRLSNFMLWRSAYSELLFIEKYWPDMGKADVTAMIEAYNNRQRRYGG